MPRVRFRIGTQTAAAEDPGPGPDPGDWQLVRIGAGGWCTRIEFAADGTAVCRNDTHAFYVKEAGSDEWRPGFTTDTFVEGTDAGNASSNGNLLLPPVGCYEVCVALSNSDIMYCMLWHDIAKGYYVYRSADMGLTWTRTAKSLITTAGNDPYSIYSYRMNGPFMAIHPTDPDTVVIGTPDTAGAFYTTNGGTSWTSISGVLAPTALGPGMFVAFDPNNGNNVYIGSDGRGVYRSTTGATGTFSLTSSGPTSFQHLMHDEHSRLWAVARSGTHWCWRFASGSWSNLNLGSYTNQLHAIVSDPSNSNKLWAQMDSGNLVTSTDAFGSVTPPNFNNTRVAPTGQPEWHEVTNETYMSAGIAGWDPVNNWISFPCGIGVFNSPNSTPGATVAWQSDNKGIEQMVCTKIISPPGGSRVPLTSFWDRTVFRIDDPDVYPTGHGFNYTQAIAHGFDIAYAIANPDTIIGYTSSPGPAEQFGVSSNGGSTWNLVTNPASLNGAGAVAAATSSNFVQVSGGNASRLRYTTNGGSSWSNSTASGIPTTGETGWGLSTIEDRHILTCDTSGHYYAYNNGSSGSTTFAGIWKSTDGGANFTQVFTGRMDVVTDGGLHYSYNAHNAQLEAVPGNAGCLFFTTGNVDGSIDTKFKRCLNAGVTWTDVSGVLEVKKFGFGKASGGGEPVLYIVGYVSGVYGVWMSENCLQTTPTWTQIGEYPLGRSDSVTAVSGDNNLYKRVYIGYRGSSLVYRDVP